MFEVTARLKVRESELEGFRHQAAEMMRLTRERDTKTLRYDWFFSDDGIQCEVRESYEDADGLLEHNNHVAEARDKLFRDHAYDHEMTIYGEPSPALATLIERLAGHVGFKRYALLQGLHGDVQALHEDPAFGHEGRQTTFEATARLTIRQGQLEGFKHQAAEVMRRMREQDEQPLRYDWFLSDDGTECEVREAYVDPDSLLEHQFKIAEAKMRLVHEFVEGHTMAFYGELSPALAGALKAMGATYNVLSFFQGLDADVLLELPA